MFCLLYAREGGGVGLGEHRASSMRHPNPWLVCLLPMLFNRLCACKGHVDARLACGGVTG